MRRKSRWQRSPGWPVQGLGTAALLVLLGLGLWGSGWAVAHCIDGIRAGIGALR